LIFLKQDFKRGAGDFSPAGGYGGVPHFLTSPKSGGQGVDLKHTRITFASGNLKLEGILYLPDGVRPFPTVIVCHPHPLYGGSMDNNVVDAVCEALVRSSITAFKFNFRGVGRSQGRYDEGRGEGEDAKAAITFVATLDQIDPARLGLCGYSAGAAFSLPACCNDKRIAAIAAISPPLAMFDFSFIADCDKPLLLVSGSNDDFTPAERFTEFCKNLGDTAEHELIEGADHFWQGYESGLAERVVTFFAKTLAGSNP
jgi:alpha/beta superfamily hydrolase